VVATTGSPEWRFVFALPCELAKKNRENRVSRKSRSPMATLAGSGLGMRNPGTTAFGIRKRLGNELVGSAAWLWTAANPRASDQTPARQAADNASVADHCTCRA